MSTCNRQTFPKSPANLSTTTTTLYTASRHTLMKRSLWYFRGHPDHHGILSQTAKPETPGQFLSRSTVVEIPSHPCCVPSIQVLAVSSRRLLIAQGLGFGNYVVKRIRVASANNVNGEGGWSPCARLICRDPGKRKKKNREQLSMQRTLSPHLQSGNSGK